jgi:processive 1,2-diacylglycerol beta-glucosyltransferase
MRNKKKILVISVSAGAGHIRAADAIKKTAERQYPKFDVEHIDFLDFIPKPMKKLFFDWYELVIKFNPELYGFLYRQTDRPKIKHITKKWTEFLSKMNAKKFLKHVVRSNPDYIVCTYFVPADIIVNAREQYSIAAPLATLITDYGIHAFWFTSKEQTYFVATSEMKTALVDKGVDPSRVVLSGIPIDPVFFEKKSIAALKKKYGLPIDKKIILILAGGKGLMKSDEVVSTLFDMEESITIVAIAGKNKTLEASLKSLTPPKKQNLVIVGWTNDMDEYMRMADLIITKSGGMSTTECMILQKPCIIVNPIPGQEEANALYLIEQKYGAVADNPKDLLPLIDELISRPQKKQRSKIPPNGAIRILDRIKKELS